MHYIMSLHSSMRLISKPRGVYSFFFMVFILCKRFSSKYFTFGWEMKFPKQKTQTEIAHLVAFMWFGFVSQMASFSFSLSFFFGTKNQSFTHFQRVVSETSPLAAPSRKRCGNCKTHARYACNTSDDLLLMEMQHNCSVLPEN